MSAGLLLSYPTSNLSSSLCSHLKSRFPRRPWIDVVSKADIDIGDDILARLPPNHLRISVTNNHNIDVLKTEVEGMVLRLLEILTPSTTN